MSCRRSLPRAIAKGRGAAFFASRPDSYRDPVDKQGFRVTIKLSRWLSPDRWAGFVTSR